MTVSQYERTLALFATSINRDLSLGHGGAYLLMCTQRTRHFMPGDIAIAVCDNGAAERWPAWCYTYRGHSIRGMYVGWQCWGARKSYPSKSFKLVELPSDLVGLRPNDSATRRFVASLCAG